MCCQIMYIKVMRFETMFTRCLTSIRPVSSRTFYCNHYVGNVSESSDNFLMNNDRLVPMEEFVSALSVEKRQKLLEEIQKIGSAEARQIAEDKLASLRWRSRFGRPSSLHKFEADPTGTYCELPEGWLEEKAAVAAEPSKTQLKQLALFNALPFIGFGFLDNLIMILAGEYIDMTIGTMLGISTLAAAALGNTISDLAGIGSAWYVESAAEKIGVRAPAMTPQQMDSSKARFSANAGRGFGVVLGCILGMFPLFFLSSHDKGKDKDKGKGKSNKGDGEESATDEKGGDGEIVAAN